MYGEIFKISIQHKHNSSDMQEYVGRMDGWMFELFIDAQP